MATTFTKDSRTDQKTMTDLETVGQVRVPLGVRRHQSEARAAREMNTIIFCFWFFVLFCFVSKRPRAHPSLFRACGERLRVSSEIPRVSPSRPSKWRWRMTGTPPRRSAKPRRHRDAGAGGGGGADDDDSAMMEDAPLLGFSFLFRRLL